MAVSTKERFLARVQQRSGDCWEWLGARSRGYGQLSIGGKTLRAHRLAYEIFCGVIGRGQHVLHSCDNPGCVNPAHLSLGTHAENMRQMADRDRARCVGRIGAQHPMTHLNEDDVRIIRVAKQSGKDLAARYGVSPQAICNIRKRRSWRHVE